MVQIDGATVLVTGANRGLGAQFVEELLARGATKVYAGARDPGTVAARPGVEPVRLDLLDQGSIDAVAQRAGDVSVVVNNAGVSRAQDIVRGDLAALREEVETNFFGTLAVTRAFADHLREHGGGAVVNVLSALSWYAWPGATSYSASKAAEWALTAGTRVELAAQGTQVVGVHLGAADTDMMAGYEGPMLDPRDVVRAALDGLEAGESEVLVDDWSRTVKAGLAQEPAAFYAEVARMQG